MKCNYCGKEAKWVENKNIYGKNFGKSYMIWWCRDCRAYVGCHNNTKKPKGKFLAKRGLRGARVRAHKVIDELWKSRKYRRRDVYEGLGKAFGYKVHIGNTKTMKECKDIIEASKLIFNKK